MTQKITIDNLNCLCSSVINKDRIAYILYPLDILADWIKSAAKKYGVTIVVITGMDWQNVFSPWPAPGVPKGDPYFKEVNTSCEQVRIHLLHPIQASALTILT